MDAAVLQEQLRQANETIQSLRLTVGQLREELGDHPAWAESWLQRKVDSQRKALRRLNQRVVNQRFLLSEINKAGRGLTKEEWTAYRDKRLAELGDRFQVTEDDSLLVG